MAPPPAQQSNANDASLIPSDDEDDDFQLSDRDDDGGSDSEDSESESRNAAAAKKVKLDDHAPVEAALSKDDVDDLWASFNAPEQPVASTSSSGISQLPAAATASTAIGRKKIKITVSYKFVGETVTQEKEVFEDSDEARIWLATQPRVNTIKPSVVAQGKQPSTHATSSIDSLFGASDSSPSSSSFPSIVDPSSNVTQDRKAVDVPSARTGPPKRARTGGLLAMSAALKAPKLNTLEKSKLDWNNFVSNEDLGDDLTKARKDGYLDKQDFLQRTEDRREEDYDKSKSIRAPKR